MTDPQLQAQPAEQEQQAPKERAPQPDAGFGPAPDAEGADNAYATHRAAPPENAGFGPAQDDERLVRDDDYDEDDTDDPVAALWGKDRVQGYREQWRELQLRFVDDPSAATSQAATLVDDAVRSLTTALGEQKQQLDAWKSAGGEDTPAAGTGVDARTDDADHTERLRVALRNYRDFLDRLLGM